MCDELQSYSLPDLFANKNMTDCLFCCLCPGDDGGKEKHGKKLKLWVRGGKQNRRGIKDIRNSGRAFRTSQAFSQHLTFTSSVTSW